MQQWGRYRVPQDDVTYEAGATEIAGQENAGLEIDGQKLQGVENDGHSIKG